MSRLRRKNMNQEEFKNFFTPYSQNVDNADRLAFWKLSDAIITKVTKRHIPIDASQSEKIFDAGGGTGKWICSLAKIYATNFILYDLSEDMLKRAKDNIRQVGIEKRVEIIQGDIADINIIPSFSVDYVISIYNPISFIEKKEKAVSELFRILKKGGTIMIMGQGYFNAVASKMNNYFAKSDELQEIVSNYKVKWNNAVPKLDVFSQESMENLLADAGFVPIATYGIPCFVQPGAEDFEPTNSHRSCISQALENIGFFNAVFDMETRFNSQRTVVNRGMNIFAVAKKE